MAAMQRAGVAGALILMLLPACDNVSWGGADVTFVPPPPKVTGNVPTDPEPGAERLPEGPVLYYVTVDDRGGVLYPVGEISGDSLRVIEPGRNVQGYADAFIAEHMRQSAEFVLFHAGARAGTLIVQSADVDASAPCRPLPRALGALELSTNAMNVREFLALARLQAPQIPRRIEESIVAARTQQVMGPILAERMLRKRGASLPSDWQRAMAQIRPLPMAGSTNPGFTATFLVGDTLGPGLDDVGNSLFYIARPQQLEFDTVFVRFRSYPTDGKQAPRVIDHLDWDRDDDAEVLLRIHGVNETWIEAVGRAGDRWTTIFNGRCETTRAVDPAGGAS